MKIYTFHLTGHEAQTIRRLYDARCVGGWYVSTSPINNVWDLFRKVYNFLFRMIYPYDLRADVVGPYRTEQSARKRAPKDLEAKNEDTV